MYLRQSLVARASLCTLSKAVARRQAVTAERTAREAPKKVSAVAFSGDGRAALFADKFGDVLAAAAPGPGPAPGQNPACAGAAPAPALAEPATNGHSAPVPAAASQPAPPLTQDGAAVAPPAAAAQPSDAAPAAGERVKPALLLGHFCSTVTALAVAPGAARLASADRDGKIRVSVLPRAPLLVRLLPLLQRCWRSGS